MWNEDDRKWLYEQMKKAGVDTGSYNEFKTSLNNKEDRDWYYQKSRSMGLNVGSANDFTTMMVEPVQTAEHEKGTSATIKPAQETVQTVQTTQASSRTNSLAQDLKDTQPTVNIPTIQELMDSHKWKPRPMLESEPYLTDDGKKAYRAKRTPGMDSEGRMATEGVYTDLFTGETYDASRPETKKIVEEDAKRLPAPGYIDVRAANRQQVDELSKEIDDALLDAKGQSIGQAAHRTKDAADKGFWASMQESMLSTAGAADPNDIIRKASDYRNKADGVPTQEATVLNKRIKDLEAAQRTMRNAKRIIAEADHNAKAGTFGKWIESSFVGGAARGFGQKLFDADNWDMGVSDGEDAISLFSALDAFDKGEKLTESQQALLDAKSVELATNAYFGSYVGKGYKAGQMTAESLPFMIEMCINPASATGTSAQAMLTRYALKRFGKKVVKDNAKKYLAAKVATRVAGDLAGSAAMSATTGMAGVTGDAISRMNGNVLYDTDDEGRSVFAGHTEGDDFGAAFRKAFAARTIENYSEMVGEYFKPVLEPVKGAVGKGLSNVASKAGEKIGLNRAKEFVENVASKAGEKIGLNRAKEFVENVTSNDFAQLVVDFEKHSKWGGTISEYAEEVAGGIMNAMVVGDQTLDTDAETGVFNLDNNIDTFLGVSLLGGAISAFKSAGYRTPKYMARKEMQRDDNDAARVFGNQEKWGGIRNTIAFGSDDEVQNMLEDVKSNPKYTEAQKRAALKYAGSVMKYRGMLDAEKKRRTEGYIDPIQNDAETSYDNGYSLETEKEKQDARNMYEYRRKQLLELTNEQSVADIDADPLGEINRIAEDANWTPEERQVALDYVNAKATFDGMIERVRDDIDSQIAASDAMIDGRVNKTDGMIHPATMKVGDRKVYVVSGNINMNEDGTGIDLSKSDESILIRDAETGNLEFADPRSVLSLDEAMDAAKVKEEAQQNIRMTVAQKAADVIEGTLMFKPGEVYNIIDDGGAAHTITVVPVETEEGEVAPDEGIVTVSMDGAEPVQMDKADVQRMADNANLARLQQFEQQRTIERQQKAAQEAQEQYEAQRPVYNLNDEITIRDDAGNLVRGSVTAEENEDGQIEVYTEFPVNGQKINLFTRDQLDAMVEEQNGVLVEPVTVQNEVQNVPVMTENVPAAEETVAVEPMPMVGKGEDAEPDFYSVSPQRGYSYLFNESGLSSEHASAVLNNNVEASNKEVDKLKGKEPKPGTSIAKFKKDMAVWEKKVEEAQKRADYWAEVKKEHDKATAALMEERRKEEEERIARAQADEAAYREEMARKESEQAALGSHNVSPSIREKWAAAPKIEGAQDEIVLPNGEKVAGRYYLVESGAASASHDSSNGFAKTEGFPVDENGGSVNDRDYERDMDAQQVTRDIANNYDSRAVQTPVVVSQDGVVLSGNGRTMAGELAAAQNTDAAYNSHIAQYPTKWGFTKQQVEGMQHPRVVFVPNESMPYTAETFAKFNQQEMKGQSKTEQAVKLGKVVSDKASNRIIGIINRFDTLGDFYADSKATSEAIAELQGDGVLSQAQMAEMYDGEGISAIGKELLENTLIGKAFESNPNAVREITEHKSMRQSIITALAEISNNLSLGKEYSLESELAQAIDLVYQARKSGSKFGEPVSWFARQQNLDFFGMGETVADYNNSTMLMIADIINDNHSSRLKKYLQIYNHNAQDSANGQLDLFTGSVHSKEDIINEVKQLFNNGSEEEQQKAAQEAVARRKAESVQENGTVANGSEAEPAGEVTETPAVAEGVETPATEEAPTMTREKMQAYMQQFLMETNGDMRLLDNMTDEELQKFIGLLDAWEEVNDTLGAAHTANDKYLNDKNKAIANKAKEAIDAAEKLSSDAFVPVQDYYNELCDKYGIEEEAETPAAEKTDNQGNPLNEDGTLKLEKLSSIDEITDEDLSTPTRSVELPALPAAVDEAIGANGKPVIIKKNIFERNAERHADLTADDSRNILQSALYNPNLYGQNQKAKRPYNWVVINTKDKEGKNRLVLLELSPEKENAEIVHWHYIDTPALETLKRQAEREDGQLLILPSETEEAGVLSSPTNDLSSGGKVTNNSASDQENGVKSYKISAFEVDQSSDTHGKTDRQGNPLTDEEVASVIDAMKAHATVAPYVEINDANWKDNVDTPIGTVKMGENQKEKLFAKGREQQYGMLVETLSNPDIVLEEQDKEQNMFHERPSSYLFVKTFQKEDGSKYVHFESVTVSQDGMEVSISSHIIRENQLKNKLKSDRLLYKATALDAPAITSAEQPIEGGSHSSGGKVTNNSANNKRNGVKNGGIDEFISDTMTIGIENVTSFPKEIRDEDTISKEQKSGKGRDGIKVKVGLHGNDLYIQYRHGNLRNNRKYWATIKIPNAIKYSAGQIIYRLDYMGSTTDVGRMAGDAILELFNKNDLRMFQIAEAEPYTEVSTEASRLATDAIITAITENTSIEISMKTQEAGQRAADENDGNAELMGASKRKRKMGNIAEAMNSANMDSDQKKVYNAFVNESEAEQITVTDEDGVDRTLNLVLGSENGIGVLHAIFRHAGTDSNYITSEDLLSVPSLFATGERSSGNAANRYNYTSTDENGNRTVLVTEKRGESEIFVDLYTNKKAPNPQPLLQGESQAHNAQRHTVDGNGANRTLPQADETISDAKVANNSDTSKENAENQHSDVEFMQRTNGTVYGWSKGNRIYLTPEGVNPNTPIHEYTHLWAKSLQLHNARLWGNIKDMLKGTPVWNEVLNDPAYKTLEGNEDSIASEVLSRLSGRNGAQRMEKMAQELLDEAKGKGVMAEANAHTLIHRVRKALSDFWHWVGTNLFDIAEFKSIDEVTDRVLWDMMSGTDLKLDEAEHGDRTEFSRVTESNATAKDKEIMQEIADGRTETVYRGMQLVEIDGKQYALPPMASRVNGEWVLGVEIHKDGTLEPTLLKADEHPELANAEGKFYLDKGNGKGLWAAYNPYWHVGKGMLNDQFAEAQDRTNLITVEGVIPTSELTDGYHADKAKDGVGAHEWKAGIIQGQLSGTREVILSRYFQGLRVVPNDEVARNIYAQINGKVDVMPTNVVPPGVRAELEKMGVQFVKTNNKNELMEGEHKGDRYTWWYGKNAERNRAKKFKEEAKKAGMKLAEWLKENGREGQLSDAIVKKADKSKEEDSNMYRLVDEELEDVNETFNEELQQQIDGKLPSNHIYRMGEPGRILLSTGVPNLPIQMNASRLKAKATSYGHDFKLSEIKDLVKALQTPLAVFAYGDKTKAQNIIVPLQKDGKNFIVGLSLNPTVGGRSLEINSIRNVFPKNNSEWLNWINQGKALYLDKEKVQTLIDQQRTILADVEYLDLNSVAKVVENFENPKLSDENVIEDTASYRIFDDESPVYDSSMSEMTSRVNGLASSKSAGYSKSQYDSYVEREKRRMRQHAEHTASLLGIEGRVTIMETPEGLKGRKANVKGWFDPKTGKIVIILSNHRSASDVVKTVLHEGVAHYGLRALFGENFNQFLDNVFQHAEPLVRQRIVDLAKKHGWDFRTATEEYLAGLAEDTNFKNAFNNGWWSRIKSLFLDMLRKIGLADYAGPSLSDNELRYILWRSYENLAEPGRYRNPFREAKDISKQMELKVGDFDRERARIHSLGKIDSSRRVLENAIASEDRGPLFRDGDPEERDRTDARYWYEQRVKSGMYQTREAMLDSMLGLHEAMKAIYGKDVHIEDIADFENAYLGENRLSSMNQDEWDCFEHLLIKPLLKEVSKLEKDGSSREEVTRYMMAKHGLERNEVMARRAAEQTAMDELGKDLRAAERAVQNDPLDQDALDALDDVKQRMQDHIDALYNENRERDYAGITGLMEEDDVSKAEDMAKQLVDEFEDKHEVDGLWQRINDVSKAILSKQYECGIINKDTYNDISSMYEFYIPLRGFKEKTSEEAYAYLTNKNSAFNAPIKKAHGRKSVADDPIVSLQTMAQSSILMCNRNVLVKHKFLNFVLNHPSDLASVSDLWIKYDDVKDEWTAVFPDNIEEDDSADVVEQKMRDFEDKMKQLEAADPGHYKRGKDAVNIPYRVVGDANLRQHQVLVKRNGRDYVITINGNPRAAQALNGLTNPDNRMSGSIGSIINTVGAINRTLSALYTTMSIDFVAGNFLRDTLYANTMVWIKESPRYARRYNKNYVKTKRVMQLLGKYRKGTLDMNNETEKMFYQFMKNGGETGYMRMADIDEHRKQIKKTLKAMNEKIPARMVRELVTTWIAEVGRGIEMRARFAAFITSREMGRTIGLSIWDAKEITVNFNKKGAGDKFIGATGQTFMGNTAAFVSGWGRAAYLFWNASLQGTFGNFGKYAMRHKGKAATAVALTFGLGLLITALAAASGDDDDDSYFDQPEHIRRQNIVFKLFGKTWGKIPLPIEQRAVYGLGELAGCVIFNHEKLEYDKLAKQLSQVLPVDLLEGYKGLIPTLLKPAYEAANNESWYGTPIWKDTPFNKHMPEWTKSYKSTDQRLVALSETLNEMSGGSKYKKGAIDINPAKMEYLLKQYSGGLFTLANQLGSMYDVASGDKEFDWRYAPMLNRMFMTGGDERNVGRGLNEKFFRYMEAYDAKASEFSAIRNDLTIPMDKKAELISEIVSDPEYMKMRVTKNVYSKMNQAYKQAMELGKTEAADHLLNEMNKLKRKFIDEMEADDASK